MVIIASSCGRSAQTNVVYERQKKGTLAEALNLLENHQEKEAIEIINYLIKRSPDSLSYLYFMKGMAFYKTREFQLSMASIDESISLDSLNYRSYAVKGDIFQQTKVFDSARVYYEKAFVGLSDDEFLLNNKGTLFIAMGNFEEALKIFQTIDSIDPHNADYLYNFAFVHYKLSRYDSALTIIDRAIFIRQDDAGLHNLRGQILGKRGNVDEAIKSFETSIRLKPQDNVAIVNLRRVRLRQAK